MTPTSRRPRTVLLALLATGAVSCADDGTTTIRRASPAASRESGARPSIPAGAVLARDPNRDAPALWSADAPPPGARGLRRDDEPSRVARDHLRRALALHHATPSSLDAARVVRVGGRPGGGRLVTFRQSAGGIEVFRGDVEVLLDGRLDLVAIGGSLHPDVRADEPAPPFPLAADQALAAAARHLHAVDLDRADVRRGPVDGGGYTRFTLDGDAPLTLARPARVKKVLHARGPRLVAAYHVEIVGAPMGDAERAMGVVLDATDATVLGTAELTRHETFAYDVFATDEGVPTNPHADVWPHPVGAPDGSHPVRSNQVRVEASGFNTNPVGRPDPWLAEGAGETRGNNVDAYTDGGPDGYGPGDLRATLTGSGTFGHLVDPGADPLGTTAQRMGAVTHLFYTTNWLHDDWYEAGFDEAAGNGQLHNFGRGGAEGDPLVAEAQDDAPSSLNNANMFTPADGDSPRMQMYLWTGRNGGPLVDSDLDVGVVAHEWGHFLHDRLTLCWSAICGAQGEGWGDFLALHLGVAKGDDLEGTYGMGVHAGAARRDAAYFGVRRFPYSRDPSRNGLTFRHVADSAELPAGPKRPNGAPNAEVHNAGEVWASMMWQAYSELLLRASGPSPRYGFAEARRRMAEYVVTGMMLAPPDPDFTEQRDAILLAAHAADPADAELLAAGFAARGAGTCAISPPKEDASNEGVVESFEVTSRLEVVSATLGEEGLGCDDDGYLDRGEVGTVEITLRNAGWSVARGAEVTVSEPSGALELPAGSVIAVPDVAPRSTVTVRIAARPATSVDGATPVDLHLVVDDPGGCAAAEPVIAGGFLDVDEVPSMVDAFEARASSWTVGGTEGVWSRRDAGTARAAFHALDLSAQTDATLTSPPMVVAADAPFVLGFEHRHDFESGGDIHWDGGVVEVSRDGGATWEDLGEMAGLEGTAIIGGESALFGRRGLVGRNPSFPARDRVVLDAGDAFAGETIRVRFRIATDPYVGAQGWTVHHVEASGVAAPPFSAVADDDGWCIEVPGEGGAAPDPSAGGAGPVGGPSGNGGSAPDGNGGSAPDGAGGSAPDGNGGSAPGGDGGAAPDGSGGAAPGGSGGSAPDGSGGSAPDGSGGSAPDGSGGSAPDGSGGSAPDGDGGSAPEGTGGSPADGAGGSDGDGDGSGSTGAGSWVPVEDGGGNVPLATTAATGSGGATGSEGDGGNAGDDPSAATAGGADGGDGFDHVVVGGCSCATTPAPQSGGAWSGIVMAIAASWWRVASGRRRSAGRPAARRA